MRGCAILASLRRRKTGTVTAVSGSFKIDCSGDLGEQTQRRRTRQSRPGILLATATDSLAPQAPAARISRVSLPHVELLRTWNVCALVTRAVELVETNVLPHALHAERLA